MRDARDPNAILRHIPPRSDPYDAWLLNNAWDAAAAADAARSLAALPRRPVFSVIVSTRDADPSQLRETLASLREQVYPDREIILVGGSIPVSASLSGRATVLDDGECCPFDALRNAAARASGDYVVILDGCPRLAPDALLEFARMATQADEPPDLIFADEDRVEPSGRRFGPRFRPGWSPELLLAQQAIGRTFAVRHSTFEAVGGVRPEFEDAWPYDLALRLAEQAVDVLRVPRILVHVPADRAGNDPADCCSSRSIALAGRALAEAMVRRGIEARVNLPEWAARNRVPAFELDFPDAGPRVTILIPTRDRIDLLRRCIDSILGQTTYRNFEVVVLDDGSTEPETLAYLSRLESPCRVVRLENEEEGFNFARIHNRAVRALDDGVEFVVFLNNDTEVRRPEWLSQLVGYGQMEGVGAVGARLLYADGRVQHAGMLTDLHDGIPGHAFKLAPWWEGGDQQLSRVARNVSAATAACLLVRRSTFLELDGFDEDRFAVGYNDVDFCLRLGERGLRCVVAPRAELLHFEGASRGVEDNPEEAAAFRAAWGKRVDPYHHPALTRRDERLGFCTRRYGPIGVGDRPIRALINVDRLDGSGTARFVRNLALGLRDRGRVVPEVYAREDGPIGALLCEAGIAVTFESESNHPNSIDRAHALTDRLSRGEYDLLHAVGLGGFVPVHAARLAGVPSLWTVRESVDFRDAFGGLDDESARAAIEAFSDAYRVIFPAWGVRRPFHPVEARWNFEVVFEDEPPVMMIPDRDDARRRLGVGGSSAVLTCLLDSDEDAARDGLLAVAELLRSGRDLVAWVSGPESTLQTLSADDAPRLLADRLRWIPDTEDLTHPLAASDLLVIHPGRDLEPGSIALGRAFGLPMVLGDVPGVDEYVRPGRDALVYEPGDVASLKAKIGQVLDDPGCRDRIVAAARAGVGSPGTPVGMVAAYERLAIEAVAVGAGRATGGPAIRLGAA